jgi:hypothetical protein
MVSGAWKETRGQQFIKVFPVLSSSSAEWRALCRRPHEATSSYDQDKTSCLGKQLYERVENHQQPL